jgi:hypothetical protein
MEQRTIGQVVEEKKLQDEDVLFIVDKDYELVVEAEVGMLKVACPSIMEQKTEKFEKADSRYLVVIKGEAY